MVLKWVDKLNVYHSPTVGKNTNQIICYRVETEIYPVMLLTFLIEL